VRLLIIGDIVGKPGRKAVKESLSQLKRQTEFDFVIANGENAAGGKGITRIIFDELMSYGVDAITMGNHVWNNKDIFSFIGDEPRLIRPANYPKGTPGRGFNSFCAGGHTITVVNLCGQVFMPDLDCPFYKIDSILNSLQGKHQIVVLDFHAEATSEKKAMAAYLDGRVAVVCGTHTHVQTADEQILPEGTAYITDIGMTGPRNSIIGVKKDSVIKKFLTKMPQKFDVAGGCYQFNAVAVEIDENNQKPKNITRIQC